MKYILDYLLKNHKKPYEKERLIIGSRCPWCKEFGRISHLVVKKNGDIPFLACSKFFRCGFITTLDR